jgi:hypothetical protein
MAGCAPEYMPILLAIVDAMAEPEFRLEDAGSTPGWEPIVVVSGRIADALGFNSGTGALRVGSRPNTSIGRFARLFMRNVAGFRPGTTDKGTLGWGLGVAVAENEAGVRAAGWEPLRVDLGFGEDDAVVMVQSALMVSAPVYSGAQDPETMAWALAQHMTGTIGLWFYTALWYAKWHPLIVMSPATAQAFARFGWGKREIQEYLYEHCRAPAWWFEEYPLQPSGTQFTIAELVERGSAPPE